MDDQSYAVFLPDEPQPTILKEFKELQSFLASPAGKKEGVRFKKCNDKIDLQAFIEEQKKESENESPRQCTSAEPVSPYRSLPTARYTEFRMAIERKNHSKFQDLLQENPRFLVNTNNDSPAILNEGFRFNAMHVACRTSNFDVVERTLKLATDYKWLTHVYGTDRCVEERSEYLLNALLNTPDLIENNTPLHYACKFGQPEIVRLLLSYPSCKRYPQNKYNEKPTDVICRGFKGSVEDKERITEEIMTIFRRGLSPARSNIRLMGPDGDTTAPPLQTSPLSHLTASLHISKDACVTASYPSTPRSSTGGSGVCGMRTAAAAAGMSSDVETNSSGGTPGSRIAALAGTPMNRDNESTTNSEYSPMTTEVIKMAEELHLKLKLNSPSRVPSTPANSVAGSADDESNSDDEDVFEDASEEVSQQTGSVADDEESLYSSVPSESYSDGEEEDEEGNRSDLHNRSNYCSIL